MTNIHDLATQHATTEALRRAVEGGRVPVPTRLAKSLAAETPVAAPDLDESEGMGADFDDRGPDEPLGGLRDEDYA